MSTLYLYIVFVLQLVENEKMYQIFHGEENIPFQVDQKTSIRQFRFSRFYSQ